MNTEQERVESWKVVEESVSTSRLLTEEAYT